MGGCGEFLMWSRRDEVPGVAALAAALLLAACGSGSSSNEGSGSSSPENTSPVNVVLLEASSPIVGGLSVRWPEASDNTTAAADLQYQVHASASPDFVPDSSTLVFEGRGVGSANVTGLTPGAQYAVRLVVIDRDGARTVGSPLLVRISSLQTVSEPPIGVINFTPTHPGQLEPVGLWVSNTQEAVKSVVWRFASEAVDLHAEVVDGASTVVTKSFSFSGTQAVSVAYLDAQGQLLGQSFLNIVVSPPPVVTQFLPDRAEMNVPTVFTVFGSGLPLTALVAIQDAECEAPVGQSAAGFTQRCTPHAAGTKSVTIKSASAGGVLSAAYAVKVSAGPVVSAIHPLNDSGIVGYANARAVFGLADEPTDVPGQDAKFGRDAEARAGTLGKIGAGSKGFDFSKIANDGRVLPDSTALGGQPGDWACTRDNVTGLLWEVKTESGLRSWFNQYAWRSSDAATNGGEPGWGDGGNTEQYVADVNGIALCGYTDWRMPVRHELLSIVDYGRASPAIDLVYFPFTRSDQYWSGSPSAGNRFDAWYVHFELGDDFVNSKGVQRLVRLVRGGR